MTGSLPGTYCTYYIHTYYIHKYKIHLPSASLGQPLSGPDQSPVFFVQYRVPGYRVVVAFAQDYTAASPARMGCQACSQSIVLKLKSLYAILIYNSHTNKKLAG